MCILYTDILSFPKLHGKMVLQRQFELIPSFHPTILWIPLSEGDKRQCQNARNKSRTFNVALKLLNIAKLNK